MRVPVSERLLTVPEVADLLRVGQRTVYRWIQDRKLPVIRLAGSTLRVASSDLEGWLRESAEPAEPSSTERSGIAEPQVGRRWAIAPAPWDEPRRTRPAEDSGDAR